MDSTSAENIDRFLQAQVEEIAIIRSVYGDEWKTENELDRSYSMEIKESDVSVTLHVTLPSDYPFESPPTFTITAPGMSTEHKRHICNLLEEVYLQNIGQTVLFPWIDKIKEYLPSLVLNLDSIEDVPRVPQLRPGTSGVNYLLPKIVHGDTIVDKKSIFQGHVACATSVNEVRLITNMLKENTKIANATNNMFAYRINLTDGTCIQDFEDDGETHGGERLLHLLQMVNVINVLVVVSIWFGGINLGPAKHSHINNAALQALDQAGIISHKIIRKE